MELVSGHDSFLTLGNQGALSILDDSFKFARACFLVSGEPWSTVHLEQGAFGGILCLLRSDWSLRWLDVCTCTDASEKGFAFAVREGCREQASEVGRVTERTRFRSSSRSIGARSRARRSIAPGAVLGCSSSDEDEVPLARRESRADFTRGVVATSGPLGMEVGGVRWLGKHNSRSTFHLVCCSVCSESLSEGTLFDLF